jgi:hypothetical protein
VVGDSRPPSLLEEGGMLLRNKRTGFVYSYSKVLANDPEFEVFEEQPVASVPQEHTETVTVPVRKRKSKKSGEFHGTDAQ